MSKTIFVTSTLTNDTSYGPYREGGADLPHKQTRVVIAGGANRADRDNRLWTPRGVATMITEEQLTLCMADPVFLKHKERGFIVVTDKEVNPDEIAVSDMTGRSNDAPITPEIVALENAKKAEDKQLTTEVNVPTAPSRAPRANTVPRGRK